MDGLAKRLKELDTEEITILEGHFSHHFASWAIVLRLAPSRLEKRFEARGYSSKKTRENLEAEALGIVLSEAAEICGQVDEIDTTDKNPQEVADLVMRIIKRDLMLPPGQVDWLMDFFDSE